MKSFLVFVALVFSMNSLASTCPFPDGDFGDVITTEEFSVSGENPTKIPQSVFWANKEFFSDLNSKDCANQFVKAEFEHIQTGKMYEYYRSTSDICDGGNTTGIILEQGRPKAIATIYDSQVECVK